MRNFKKILAPVDFSSASDESLALAADVAQKFGATLVIAHVFQPPIYPLPEGYVVFPPSQLADMFTEFDRQLDAAKDRLRATGVNVETVMLQGAAPTEIIKHAVEGHFDLIVMATHGRTGLSHALIGSVTEKVTRKSPCPVLTVRVEETKADKR